MQKTVQYLNTQPLFIYSFQHLDELQNIPAMDDLNAILVFDITACEHSSKTALTYLWNILSKSPVMTVIVSPSPWISLVTDMIRHVYHRHTLFVVSTLSDVLSLIASQQKAVL